MNIITRRTILYYAKLFPLAYTSLLSWYDEIRKTNFKNFNELKGVYRNASVVANNRAVFNIKGNSYRLVVSLNFETQSLYVIWFGTHSAYDKIDVAILIKKNSMQNNWMVLKTEDEYDIALERTIEIFHSEKGTPEFHELELLLLLVKDYEDRHYQIPDLDPIELIKLKLEEKGLKQKDLEPIIGSKGYVSSVLSGKKELTLKMVRGLHEFLGIPAEAFLTDTKKKVKLA